VRIMGAASKCVLILKPSLIYAFHTFDVYNSGYAVDIELRAMSFLN
jgi:hypothetical protein